MQKAKARCRDCPDLPLNEDCSTNPESLQSMGSADDPHHRLETPLPAPQNSEAPHAPDSRWRWMENRWLVLLVTMAVSIASEMIITTGASRWAVRKFTRVIQTFFSSVGVTLPEFFGVVPYVLAMLWFHPIALQLGSQRAAIWIGLVGVGTAVGVSFFGDIIGTSLMLLFPCIAMIGRRSRSWMALCNGVSVALALVVASLAYAAILIFGTTLIPKKPATAVTTD
jgi:hypothetical protein